MRLKLWLGRKDYRAVVGRPPADAPLEELTPLALAAVIRERLQLAQEYTRARRTTWRRAASVTRLLSLGLSATATIALGLAAVSGWAALGFICTALVTTIGAVEPYFNWRSRWILAEEAVARWYTIEDELVLYVAATAPEDIEYSELLRLDASRQAVWDEFSSGWMAHRRQQQGETR